MLSERQVEPAAQQFRVAHMRGEPALVAVGRQSHQRVEVVVLVEIEKHVAVVQVLHLDGRKAAVAERCRSGRSGRSGRQRRDHQQTG